MRSETEGDVEMKWDEHFFNKSCEQMDEIESDSISLTVTSPPYWNAIDYEQHVEDPAACYRTRRGEEYAAYLDFLKRSFGECLRVTKPGGFGAIVIGTVLLEGKHYPLSYHFVTRMVELGWQFHQDIVWYKVTGGVKRAGVTIQNPYPGYFYPNIMTEYILIFKKPGPKSIYSDRSSEEKEANLIPIDDLFKKEMANNIWHIAPVPPNHLDHPCPFPEEIPYRLILLYSYKGDTVLDPFLGIGTTAKVARALGRNYYGYDTKENYLITATKRLTEPLHLRSEQLVSEFRKVPYSPSDKALDQSTAVQPRLVDT